MSHGSLLSHNGPTNRKKARKFAKRKEHRKGTVTLFILLPQNIIVFVRNAKYLFVIDIVVVIFNSFMLFLVFTFLSKLKA